MTARTSQEELRRRRRRRLAKGLLIGGAALGVPALINAMMSRRSERLRNATWGRPHRYAWTHGEIHFQRLGDGDPIVLLHSFGPGHDSEEWRAVAEYLAQKFKVIIPDLLGWGRSDKPRITYDGELYIGQVFDFLEDVVREPCTLVAAGLPAAYAIQAAADHPELVKALALVGPYGIDLHGEDPDIKDALVHRLLQVPIIGTSALNLYTSRTAIQQYLNREVFASTESVDASHIDHYYRSSHQPGSHAPLAAYLSGYLNHSAEEILSRLQLPIWLGWGRHAKSPPVETADLWLSRLPKAELEVFEHGGSLPHLEVPARFWQKIESFILASAN